MDILSTIEFTIRKARIQVVLGYLFKLLWAIVLSLLLATVVSVNSPGSNVGFNMVLWLLYLTIGATLFLVWYVMLAEGKAVISVLKGYKGILIFLESVTPEQLERIKELSNALLEEE